jgi:hypothetical protein
MFYLKSSGFFLCLGKRKVTAVKILLTDAASNEKIVECPIGDLLKIQKLRLSLYFKGFKKNYF